MTWHAVVLTAKAPVVSSRRIDIPDGTVCCHVGDATVLATKLRLQQNIEARCKEELVMVANELETAIATTDRQMCRAARAIQVPCQAGVRWLVVSVTEVLAYRRPVALLMP